jgi:dihydrofolate reductase
MSTVVMHNVVSVDGYIADENDEVGPLFDWYFNGDHPLVAGEMDEPAPGGMRVSKASYDYIRPTWDGIGSMVVGRHLFDMTNGWEGRPPAGEHVIVVSHRPKPDEWHPEASYHFVDDVAQAVAKAKELAGERTVAVAAGDVGGQALALGLVDEVAMDVARWCSGQASGTSGQWTASTCWRTPTWSSGASGCCTCATGCAAEGPRQPPRLPRRCLYPA